MLRWPFRATKEAIEACGDDFPYPLLIDDVLPIFSKSGDQAPQGGMVAPSPLRRLPGWGVSTEILWWRWLGFRLLFGEDAPYVVHPCGVAVVFLHPNWEIFGLVDFQQVVQFQIKPFVLFIECFLLGNP